jgi:hypothetical protein
MTMKKKVQVPNEEGIIEEVEFDPDFMDWVDTPEVVIPKSATVGAMTTGVPLNGTTVTKENSWVLGEMLYANPLSYKTAELTKDPEPFMEIGFKKIKINSTVMLKKLNMNWVLHIMLVSQFIIFAMMIFLLLK